MKSLIIYYFSILLPFPLLIYSAFEDGKSFFITLVFYLIYRDLVDGARLVKKGVIKKKDFWKTFIPLYYRAMYFQELYFEQ